MNTSPALRKSYRRAPFISFDRHLKCISCYRSFHLLQHVGRKECEISLRLPQPRLDHSPPAGDLKYHDLIICADLISEADDLPQRMPDAWKCSELICHLNKAEAQHHWDVMSLLLMFNVGLFHFWISNQCESIQMLRPHVNSFSYLHNCFFHLLEAWYWWDGHARDRLFIEHHWFPQTA